MPDRLGQFVSRLLRRKPKPLVTINGEQPVKFIQRAYDLIGPTGKHDGPGRFDMSDPVQKELRLIRDWIRMAEHDALEARRDR